MILKLQATNCFVLHVGKALFTKSKSETERKQLKDSRDVLIFSLGILGKRQILVFIDIIIVILFIRKLSATIGVIMGYNIS